MRARFGLANLCALVGVGLFAGCTAQASEGDTATAEPVQLASADGEAIVVKVYKSPTCGCCANWVEHLVAAGFEVDVEDTDQMPMVKADAGVPANLQSCHTAIIDDYVFEGHIPIETIQRFLEEAPDVDGLAVPGMPVGSPGMEMGDRVDPYDVIAFDGARTSVYESHR
ncbi:MAG: DUF411 domain-containing protein [Gemmatimonadota bacterium]|nr:DUF411 domain-containing protein [Gemmatimonadota bacterium]